MDRHHASKQLAAFLLLDHWQGLTDGGPSFLSRALQLQRGCSFSRASVGGSVASCRSQSISEQSIPTRLDCHLPQAFWLRGDPSVQQPPRSLPIQYHHRDSLNTVGAPYTDAIPALTRLQLPILPSPPGGAACKQAGEQTVSHLLQLRSYDGPPSSTSTTSSRSQSCANFMIQDGDGRDAGRILHRLPGGFGRCGVPV